MEELSLEEIKEVERGEGDKERKKEERTGVSWVEMSHFRSFSLSVVVV